MVRIPKCTCPHTQKFFSIIGKKWALFILQSIHNGAHTFTDIRKDIGDANTKILTDRLTELVDCSIITKNESGKYFFTEHGEELTIKILEISNWWCSVHKK